MAVEHEMLATGLPDRQLALLRYSEHADQYDSQTDWASSDRARVVELLDPRPGEVIADVGCGTGLCFGPILERVGEGGLLVGIEPCAEMLGRAQERIDHHGWDNVDLILGGAEEARLDQAADGALFCFTHDVLRTPGALKNVLSQVKPAGRVAAVGPMWAPWWAPGMNMMIWYVASQYVTTFEGFSAPWTHLAELVPDLVVEPRELAGIFFASGTLPG